jgi:glucose/arabinose dehydrogenase
MPAAILDVHSSSNGIDFSRSSEFGYVGQAFVAQFGDQASATGKVFAPVGFKVVRVDVQTGVINEFAVNKGSSNGPASWLRNGGLERPLSVRFDPNGSSLYVVDFGVMTMADKPNPYPGTGVLWRISRSTP